MERTTGSQEIPGQWSRRRVPTHGLGGPQGMDSLSYLDERPRWKAEHPAQGRSFRQTMDVEEGVSRRRGYAMASPIFLPEAGVYDDDYSSQPTK